MSEHERHLTEEMLLGVQMGDADREAERAHLASCKQCQQRAEPLSDALRWFGAAAREFGAEKAALAAEWRESKAALAQDWRDSKRSANQEWRESRAMAVAHRRSFIATWAAVAAVLLLTFGLGLAWQQHRAELAARVQQQQRQQQQLTEDDALLEEVDQDVSQVVPDAMQPLSLNSSSTAAGTTSTRSHATATRQ
jgi:hypothetical protein